MLGASITAADGMDGGRDGAEARAYIILLSNGGTEIEKQEKKSRAQPLKIDAQLREGPEAAGSCVCAYSSR
jgi:hypothetical protein